MAKPTGSSHFTYNNLEKEVNNVYNILYNSCTESDYYEHSDTSGICNKYSIKETDNGYVNELLRKLHHNIKKIYYTANNRDNGYFKKTVNNVKEYCIYFKYWLYDEILSKQECSSKSELIYDEWQKCINNQEYNSFSNRCTFYKLSLDDIEKLKRIYAFKLIFYDNISFFNAERNIPCKYLSELGKGLKAYEESHSKCSIANNEEEYCKEFQEFQNLYNLDKLHLKTSESSDYQFYDEETVECPLVIESLNDPLRLLYKEGINRWYLTDQYVFSLNSSIASASSAIGATVGVSTFILYLYKFTNIGSLFGSGKQKDHTMFSNVDEGSHNFTFPTSESKHTNFGNNEYNVSYYSVDNS
ncbi:PIR Superfamily Protein [Plasmodium ovale wallikeri]|uniref:PIR Superfamily Protein n=1 Tax=Plasmodium ovale wallikeri TaxID=864142 RepID=A0A1A9AH71_PLAOA|nr:PIR Superfamily Protein [Plasmodium ovale wallikeri]SBT56382.1 PIR Superfamily Protein [Plasmodium ovale wallikeri]